MTIYVSKGIRPVNLVVFTSYPHSGKSELASCLASKGYENSQLPYSDGAIEVICPGLLTNVSEMDVQRGNHAVEKFIKQKHGYVGDSRNTEIDLCAPHNALRRRLLSVPCQNMKKLEGVNRELFRWLVYLDVDKDILIQRNLKDRRLDESDVMRTIEWFDSNWENPKSYTDGLGNLNILEYPNNDYNDQAAIIDDLGSKLKIDS